MSYHIPDYSNLPGLTVEEAAWEVEAAQGLGDNERVLDVIMAYHERPLRPIEIARMGGWAAEASMLREAYGTSLADHMRRPWRR